MDHRIEDVEKHVQSVRQIVLTVNVVCAFVLLLTAQVLFGWQSFRPSASREIFEYNLIEVAKTPVNLDSESGSYNRYEQGIVLTARMHVAKLILGDGWQKDSLLFGRLSGEKWLESCTLNDSLVRKKLDSAMDCLPVWIQEEQLTLFVNDIDSSSGKSFPPPVTHIFEIMDKTSKNIRVLGGVFVIDTLDSSRAASLNRLRPLYVRPLTPIDSIYTETRSPDRMRRQIDHVDLLFCVQEIRDRQEVNEQTRGRRISPREKAFPILGTSFQMEDVGIPIAVFFLFLAYWLYGAMSNEHESTRLLLNNGRKDAETAIDEPFLKKLATIFFFIEWPAKRVNPPALVRRLRILGRRNSIGVLKYACPPIRRVAIPQARLGLMWLLMAPYLVTMGWILANLHETMLLDFRNHGGLEALNSGLGHTYMLKLFVESSLAGAMAWFGWKSIKTFICIYKEIAEKSPGLQLATGSCAETKKLKRAFARRLWWHSRALTIWVILTPFLTFGVFVGFYYTKFQFSYDYFLNRSQLVIYISTLTIFIVSTAYVFSRKVPGAKLKFLVSWKPYLFVLVSTAILWHLQYDAVSHTGNSLHVFYPFVFLRWVFWIVLGLIVSAAIYLTLRYPRDSHPRF